MRTSRIKRRLCGLTALFALLCTGCDGTGTWDIVRGSLQLAAGIVDVAT